MYNCIFTVPEKPSWKYISPFASKNNIGEILDNAFHEIEKYNSELKGLFDKIIQENI